MFTDLLSRSHDLNCRTLIRVRCADLDARISAEAMEELLTRHVLECETCLAAALFLDESLAQTGCAVYRELLAQFKQEPRISGICGDMSRCLSENGADAKPSGQIFVQALDLGSLSK